MQNGVMNDDRIVEIESKIAHQEHLLAELNTALSSQQTQLLELQDLCKSLVERLRSMSEAPEQGNPLDERPPHY